MRLERQIPPFGSGFRLQTGDGAFKASYGIRHGLALTSPIFRVLNDFIRDVGATMKPRVVKMMAVAERQNGQFNRAVIRKPKVVLTVGSKSFGNCLLVGFVDRFREVTPLGGPILNRALYRSLNGFVKLLGVHSDLLSAPFNSGATRWSAALSTGQSSPVPACHAFASGASA